jgi:hypothetical protein
VIQILIRAITSMIRNVSMCVVVILVAVCFKPMIVMRVTMGKLMLVLVVLVVMHLVHIINVHGRIVAIAAIAVESVMMLDMPGLFQFLHHDHK